MLRCSLPVCSVFMHHRYASTDVPSKTLYRDDENAISLLGTENGVLLHEVTIGCVPHAIRAAIPRLIEEALKSVGTLILDAIILTF